MAQPKLPTLPLDAAELDNRFHALMAKASGGLSPIAQQLALADWLMHLLQSPGTLAKLAQQAVQPAADAAPDKRFDDAAWQAWPFNLLSQQHQHWTRWWQGAAQAMHGVSPHHAAMVGFMARQWLDALSPANTLATNPLALSRTAQTGGTNLLHGLQNLVQDLQRQQNHQPPEGTEKYRPGHEVAVTPGQVVLRNRLIELIQYQPTTAKVHPEPILIVPAWIMKYYILDLSPENSLIKYLVDRGHTVFAMSWLNPTAADAELGMDDYLQHGVMAAIDAISTIVPKTPVHAVGYCLGGTLLTMAAAAMARDDDQRLASVSLFAAQTDFTEPGGLSLFIDDSQVSALGDHMRAQGTLESGQMGGAFAMLNANDLIWSRVQNDYLMGARTGLNDLMAWNADGTRLPRRMHTEYLQHMFLRNDLASARYPVGPKPVALCDIACPLYVLGTVRDHVAPWHSVYKLHLLTHAPLTFTLTTGGHNVGVVNPPGNPKRSFQSLTRNPGDKYKDPDTWVAQAPSTGGSWWPHWADWLKAHSGKPRAVPPMGAADQGLAPLCDAPGTYVLQK
jgi:polyhydroxyalkanoate synthase